MTLNTLSNTIARAILATVEKDRCCNLGNIEETVFRELAVAEAKDREKPQESKPFNVYRNVEQAAINALTAVDVHSMLGRVSRSFDRAFEELRDALKQAGAL